MMTKEGQRPQRKRIAVMPYEETFAVAHPHNFDGGNCSHCSPSYGCGIMTWENHHDTEHCRSWIAYNPKDRDRYSMLDIRPYGYGTMKYCLSYYSMRKRSREKIWLFDTKEEAITYAEGMIKEKVR